MRFSSIRVRGIGPFKEETSVDLEAVPGTVIAVCGKNGAGKSTLLELLAAGLYRQCPTRGSLADLANGRNASLEVGFVNGASYTLRHLVDSISGKGESYAIDATGAPVTASGKLTEFKSWAQSHLPPQDLLFASTFAPQGSAGFVQMSPAERKSVLLRALGLERFEQLADKARESARAAKQEATNQAAVIDALNARLAAAPATPNMELLSAGIDAAKTNLAQREEELAQALQAATKYQLEKAEAERANEVRVEVEQELVALAKSIADIDERCTNNSLLLDRHREIRAAAKRTAELVAEIDDAAARVSSTLSTLRDSEASVANARAALASEQHRKEAAELRITSAQRLLEQLKDVPAAAESLPALESELASTEEACAAKQARVTSLEQSMIGIADERASSLRGALDVVLESKKIAEAHAAARSGVQRDDELVATKDDTPKQVERLRQELALETAAAQEVFGRLKVTKALAGNLASFKAAQVDLAQAQKELEKAQDAIVVATDKLSLATTRLDVSTHDHAEACILHVRLQEESASLRVDAARAPRLEDAERRINELSDERVKLCEKVKQLTEKRNALPPPFAKEAPNVAAAQNATELARALLDEVRQNLVVAESVTRECENLRATIAEHETKKAVAFEELSDWVRLSDDLGKDGLQALEIDAAGPELTAIVNDLLHTCVGPRWSVTIETQRNSADGKRTLEGCDVSVLDTLEGRRGNVETFSGGERVLLGEAISLALSMLACRRSGVKGPTIVRDETGAALDEEKSVAYVAMLRRAAELVGASRVLFVSHNASTWDLADSRINVANGKVSIS